jgi:AraC family transcriptional regulator, arabinose operon regulatory protein
MLPMHTTRINLAGRVRTTPGWSLDKNWGPRFADLDIWFVWSGTGWLKTGLGKESKTHPIRPGFCLIARGGNVYEASHSNTESLGVNFIHFDLTDALGTITTHSQPHLLPPEVSYVHDVAYVDSVTRRIVQLANDRSTLPLANALLAPVFEDLSRQAFAWAKRPPSTALDQHIAAWAARIQEDPTRVPSVAQMAAQSNCTPDHFTRLFKQAFGHSPQQALIHARVARARQLLLETNLKIREIALSLGYCDEFFFARQFKQQTGKTPRQIRQV